MGRMETDGFSAANSEWSALGPDERMERPGSNVKWHKINVTDFL